MSGNGKAFVIIFSISSAVYLFCLAIGEPDMALTASLCTAMIWVAIGMCWDLRTRVWFWIVIAIVSALHMPLLFIVHWPHYWIPGKALTPLGVVDCMIIVGIVRFVQRKIMKDDSSKGDEQGTES